MLRNFKLLSLVNNNKEAKYFTGDFIDDQCSFRFYIQNHNVHNIVNALFAPKESKPRNVFGNVGQTNYDEKKGLAVFGHGEPGYVWTKAGSAMVLMSGCYRSPSAALEHV